MYGKPARVRLATLLLSCLLPCLAAAQITQGPPRIRNVYIPADQLQVLFAGSDQGMLLPRDQVLELWQKAQRHDASAATPPPAAAVATQAVYEAQLDAHELRIAGRIQVVALRGGWQAVALPLGGLAIQSAQLDGQPARLGRHDDGALFLLLDQQGSFELQLEMSAPLASRGGDLATTLRWPPLPAAEFRIELPEGKQLLVGQTVWPADSVADARQTFRVAIEPTGLLPLVISDRSAAGQRSPLVLVHSRIHGHLEPAGLRWEAFLDLDVYARPTEAFQLRLPAAVDVAEVEATELDQWTIRDQGDGTAAVSVAFRKPFLGRRTVRLLGFAPLPLDAAWHVPTLAVLEAASHAGQLSLTASPSLRVEVGTLAGIRPERRSEAAAEGLPAADAVPLTFAFWDEEFQLPLRLTTRRRTVQASWASLLDVQRAGVTLHSSLRVEPRQAPLFEVQMRLPRAWQVASVLAAGQAAEWESVPQEQAEPGAEVPLQTIRLDLARPLPPGESLDIVLTARQRPEDWLQQDGQFGELALPELRVDGADEVGGTLLVQAPPDIELQLLDLSDDLQPVAAEGAGGDAAEAGGTALQYRYQDEARIAGRLLVRTKPAKLSAETLTFVRLDRGKLDVHCQVDWHIRQGTVRQLGWTLPAAVGEKVRMATVDSPVRIIEQRQVPLAPARDGDEALSAWQIVLDQPVTGHLCLALDFGQTFPSSPAGQDAQAAAPGASAAVPAGIPIHVPVLALQDVARQSGMVAVEAAGDQQVDCAPRQLRELDPADVIQPRAYAPSQRIVAAYHYPRLPYQLTLSATRHASEPVLNAICEAAEIISVAGQQGRMRHQARFSVRSLHLQHVPIRLPDSADLWSVLLDNEPVEVRRNQGAYLVSWPPAQAGLASESRFLTLLYETDIPRFAGESVWQQLRPQMLRQQTPEIAMPTLGTTWYVHPPTGMDWVSTEGEFRAETPQVRPALVTRLAETIARHSTSGLPWKVGGLIAAGIFVGLYAVGKTSKSGGFSLVELLVVIAIIGVLVALLLPATQSAREAARRSQCHNNLKMIGLALHNYHDVYGQFPPAVIGPNNVPRQRQFSWLVALLPFLEQRNLYDSLRLDLPWDDPHNLALLQRVLPDAILCPSEVQRTTEDGFFKTSYVAVTGAAPSPEFRSSRGIIALDRGLRMEEITDGTSNTIVVGEVTDGGPWFAGGAGTARRIDDWIVRKPWSQHPGGGVFLFADGSVQFITPNVDSQTLRRLAIAQDGQTVTLDGYGSAPARPSSGGAGSEPVPPASSLAPQGPDQQEPAAAEAEEQAGKKLNEDVLADRPAPVPDDKPAELLPPEPAEPQPPPLTAEPAPPPPAPRGERARLSLLVALERPGGEALRFRREGGTGELVIGLQNRTSASVLQWLVVAALVLAAWTARQASRARRGIAVIVGLAVPMGLSGLCPPAWTPLLDGLLLGTLAAVGVWLAQNVSVALTRSWAKAAATGLAAGGLLLASLGVAAEVPPAAELPVPPASAREQTPDDKPTAPGTGQPERPPATPGLTLYVPYDPGRDQPLQNTRVYLPHDEFLRLWRQAHPDQPAAAPPEVPAMVSHAEYVGQLEDGAACFDGRLLIHDFADGWTRVALPLGDVALERIEIAGRPATLAGAAPPPAGQAIPPVRSAESEPGRSAGPAEPQPAIYLDKPGPYVVDLRFRVPVNRLGATGQLIVPLRPVSAGQLRFHLPADDLEVQLSGGPGGWRRQTLGVEGRDGGAAGQPAPEIAGGTAAPENAALPAERTGSFILVPLGANADLDIRWQPRRAEARDGHLTSVDHALRIDVLDSGLHYHSQFRYRIQQGAVRELQLRIPPGLAVARVEGAEVADWSLETEPSEGPEAGRQRLVVSLKAALTSGVDLDIHALDRDRPVTGTIDIPSLEPLGVVRETGRIAIGCSSHFRVHVGATDRLDQIDRAGFAWPQSAGDGCGFLSAYRYTSRPWRLQLESERYRPRVEVTDRTAVAVAARHVALRSLLSAEVRGAPITSLAVRLPRGLRVSQVRVPPEAEWFLEREDQDQQLRVEWQQPAEGRFDLALAGTLARDGAETGFAVPGVAVAQAQAQRGQLAIYVDDDLEAVLVAAHGLQPIDPARLDRELRPDDRRAVRYAFAYDEPPDGVRLQLAPAASRRNAEVVTVVSVRDGAVAYLGQVNFEIQQAACSRFQIVTPLWLGDDLELQGEQIRQIRSRVGDSGRIWEIELQQPVRGTYCVQLLQTLPLPDDGSVPAALIRPLEVERLRSQVVLENATADEVAQTTLYGAVPIEIADVAASMTDAIRRRIVAAYQIHSEAAELAWTRRVRQQDTGLQATIPLADLATVIQADGRYRARAAYNIRNRTLQFLEIELPPASRVWSVHVSDQPVRPATLQRQGRPITLLPLQKTSAGDFSSRVVVVYSGQLPGPLHRWTRIQPPAPQILSDVPVSRTLWTVCLPPEYGVRLVKQASNLELVAAEYQQEERKLSFLDEMRDIVQVASSLSKSAARSKAWDNLKRIDLALQEYAQEQTPAGPQHAAAVREQAQQVEADIRRLETLRVDAERAELDAAAYFGPRPRGPEDQRAAVDLIRSFESLAESPVPSSERAALDADRSEPLGEGRPRPEERRDDLRKRAVEQLAILQTRQQQQTAGAAETAPAAGLTPSGQWLPPSGAPQDELAEAAAAAGHLSLDVDLPLVGTAYHFRKLHGDPRLVLDARHESLLRTLLALVWAGVCLALSVAASQLLRRPRAAHAARRGWPWLALALGAIWLFLLPLGVFGLLLLVAAACALVARVRKPVSASGKPSPNQPQAT